MQEIIEYEDKNIVVVSNYEPAQHIYDVDKEVNLYVENSPKK